MQNIAPTFVLSTLLITSPLFAQTQSNEIPKITRAACSRVSGVIQADGTCSYKGMPGEQITTRQIGKKDQCKVDATRSGGFETMTFALNCDALLQKIALFK